MLEDITFNISCRVPVSATRQGMTNSQNKNKRGNLRNGDWEDKIDK